jgi:hypothetical protein
MLLLRYGKPDEVLACSQPAASGFCDAPLFLWRRKELVIALSYTPFSLASSGRQIVGLQVMLPEVPLERRYKTLEATAAEIELLSQDVRDINPMQPARQSDINEPNRRPVMPDNQKPRDQREPTFRCSPWVVACLGVMMISAIRLRKR